MGAPQLQASDSLKSDQKIIEFDKSLIEDYQNNEDYNYFKTVEEDSAWDKFTRWLNLQWNKFIEWLLSGVSEGSFWNYLALVLKILLIVGIGVLILWLFSKYYITNKKTIPRDESQVNLSEEERLIQQKDLSTLIQEAEEDENYRLASRYLFLNVLKHLKDKNLIDYRFQKTNADYKSEIKAEDLRSDFSYAARFYEFVWYGDFTLKAAEFQNAKLKFESILMNIQNTKAHG